MESIDTAVITANWNGKGLLKECLGSLRKQSYRNFITIVVDNGSTDGSAEYVMKNFPEVKVIRLKKNRGFTGGNNAGFIEAMKDKDIKYLVTLNNDAVVGRDWLKNLISAAKSDKNIASCSSKVLYLFNKDKIDTAGIAIYQDGHGQSRGGLKNASKYTKKEEIFGASAVAALWKREALEKVGLFDSMFFMYQEEIDLAWRLRYVGYKSVFVPNAIVYHAHSASSKPFSPLKAYYSERNRIWLVFKNFTWSMILKSKYYTLKRYISLVRGAKEKKGAAGKFMEKNSFLSIILVLLKAYFIGIIALPLFIPKRIIIQYTRIKNHVSNKQIKEWFRRFSTDSERIAMLKV